MGWTSLEYEYMYNSYCFLVKDALYTKWHATQ
jgi:hypothetical protein